MYKVIVASAVTLLLVACNKPCPECKQEEPQKVEVTKKELKDLNDKLNYSVGYDVGRSAARNQMELKDEIFLKGVKDGMNDEENPEAALMDDKERIETKREHSKIRREEERKQREVEAVENKKKADAFMAENKSKEGVITTETGLQYIIEKEGDGPKPAMEDRVSVHYKGTLIDGTEFDSSYKRNRPATFPVGRVVKGWTEALQLMPVGSKWKLFIPPDLGYGERGAGSKIGPNSALIFEIELLEIISGEETAPGAPAASGKPAPPKPAAKKSPVAPAPAAAAAQPAAAE
ncbi:MAG: FKBP-type peptidyl-prolyl cis-trans isomerase [Deltaproteobacteria bacterium]|nr:FKBP-type peptidyl-prolyl cis-trans isomerase [Deltaproteobacteria bacterium]